MTTNLKDALGAISGGEVLDIATGSGGFVHLLAENLKDYASITGVDTSEKALAAAAKAFAGQENIRFLKMDAAKLDFPAASFDTVCIANSLHHLKDRDVVLAEMRRTLKPGGRFILMEMFRDGQTEAQLTHVLLHHWWAAVDTAGGVTHDETFTRQQLVEIAHSLGLHSLAVTDYADLSDDPRDPETIQYLEGVINQYQERAKGLPGEAELVARGGELRQRLHRAGFHSATELVVVGE